MENSIALVEAIKTTLKTIPLYVCNGVDAMDKLEGCCNALDTVIGQLRNLKEKQQEAGTAAPVPEEKE